MIASLHHAVDGSFWWVLSASVDASLTIVVIAMACRFARRWLALRSVLLLWMVVWFNFFVPGFLPWTLGPWWDAVVTNAPIASRAEPVFVPAAESSAGLLPAGDTAAVSATGVGDVLSLTAVLPWLWLLAALALATRSLLAARHWRRGLRDLTGAREARIRPVLARAAAALEMRSLPGVYVHPSLSSPAVTGWWRASVALPVSVADSMDVDGLHSVFLHELAHIQRGDHRLNGVMVVMQWVHWFNPLVYLARRETRTAQEFLCDARVVAALGQEYAPAYGNRLLDLFESARWPKTPLTALPMVLERSQLTRRIVMLANPRPLENSPVRFVPLFLLLLLVASIRLSVAQPEGPMETIPVETYPPNYPGGIFQPGDDIEITSVAGTADEFIVGETYTVRGAYTLASAPDARMGFLATGGTVSGQNWATVTRGQGTFTLTGVLTEPGSPHVSLYPTGGGEGFGGIYFREATSAGKTAAPTIPIAFDEATPTWTKDQDQSGNGITIQRVVGTRPQFEEGGVYTIEGRYTLTTHERARLIFYATNGKVESVSYDEPNGIHIEKGSGHFRLTARIAEDGVPHISMYPAVYGEGFFNRYVIEKGAADVPAYYVVEK